MISGRVINTASSVASVAEMVIKEISAVNHPNNQRAQFLTVFLLIPYIYLGCHHSESLHDLLLDRIIYDEITTANSNISTHNYLLISEYPHIRH